MSDTDRGQISRTAAEVYEVFFVPALFAQWTDIVLDTAHVRAAERVVDVGCGTGVLARAALRRVGTEGSVDAVDPNDGMLSVARRTEPQIGWHNGVAEALPFPDRHFDRAVSQFALMFFTDPTAAFEEVARVTRRGGMVALALWDRLESNPGYARLAAIIEDLFGVDAAEATRAPFQLAQLGTLSKIGETVLAEPAVTSHQGVARFESLEAWLHTEIRGWTLADVVDDHGFATLVDRAKAELVDLVNPSGVSFPVTALVISGRPR